MPRQKCRENSTDDQTQDHDNGWQGSSGKPRTLTFIYVVAMVARTGLKGLPANVMADVMCLQPEV